MEVNEDTTPPQTALILIRTGGFQIGPEWQRAHELCQLDEGERQHDLVHALCHWVEGDLGNRDYWYRRAGDWTPAGTIEAEWVAMARELGVDTHL